MLNESKPWDLLQYSEHYLVFGSTKCLDILQLGSLLIKIMVSSK